jgi:hypothetical protein
VRVGRIEFRQVERMPLTNDPRLMEIRYPFNDNAKALEQLQEIVADLTERVERLEKSGGGFDGLDKPPPGASTEGE